jgi:hypothetical protein
MDTSQRGNPSADSKQAEARESILGIPCYVTMQQVDASGNYTRERLPLNEAVLSLLRFARKHPDALCTIELRELDSGDAGAASADGPLRIVPIWEIDRTSRRDTE